MDIITFHSLWTLLLFICFIAVVVWAYSHRRQAAFVQAAALIFDHETNHDANAANTPYRGKEKS